MHRKLLFIPVAVLLAAGASALEWPAETLALNKFFGQKQGNVFNNGIIFSAPGTVRAADRGKILVTLEVPEDMEGFPSALGNAVITVHEGGLMTIYGNLENANTAAAYTEADKGTILGKTGDSAWQEKKGGLIFAVSDMERKTWINPLLLLPQLEDTAVPEIRTVTAESETGSVWTLGKNKTIPRGTYKLYGNIQDSARTPGGTSKKVSPFRISVTVNGVEQFVTSYEVLSRSGGTLYLDGTKPSNFTVLYPDKERTLLAPLKLARGKALITVTVRDINGNEKNTSYTIQVE